MTEQPIPARRFRALLPWVALVLVGLIAGAPLLDGSSVPGGYDTSFHAWRAVEATELLRAGVLVPRWAPHMARGYGYPLFIFQGALSAQIAALLHLVGLSWVPALNGAYLLGLVGAALTCYLLARELWGRIGGWGAAAASLFVPYHLYVVYYRSSLSETVAWIFPPLALWGMARWARGDRRGLWVGAVALAALAMTHAVSLYLFVPLFLLWGLAEVVGRCAEERRRAAGRLALLLLLGGGLGLFAWGPGLLERGAVQLGRATAAWVFDYQANFLPWAQLLALPRAADPRLINDWPARGLGLLFLLAAVGGFAVVWLPRLFARGRARSLTRARAVALALCLAGCLFLATGLSRPLWDAVPLLAGFQFPWRWLAPASLAAVLLAGGAVRWLAARHHLLALGFVALWITAHWGWLYPPRGTLPDPLTPAGLVAWELATDTVGTTASNELLPVEAVMPPRDNPVTAALLAGEAPDRLDRTALPAGTELLSAQVGLLEATYRMRSPRDFIARFRAFAYPGWRATVNGAPVDVVPDPATGWVTFPVPDGDVSVVIWFGETAQRAWLGGLSLLSLLGLSTLSLWPSRVRRRSADGQDVDVPLALPSGAVTAMVITGVMLFLFKVGIADRLPRLWRASNLDSAGVLRRVDLPLDANFGDHARLLGIDGLPATLREDDPPVVSLYWRAVQPGDADWHVGFVLIGPDGFRRQPVLRPYRWSRTPPPLRLWSPDDYARMDYELHLPAGTPPGTYTVALSLFDRATAAPASLLDAASNPVGPALTLGEVVVRAPTSAPSLAALGVDADARRQACGPFGLWSAGMDREAAAPGEVVHLRMVWEALAEPAAEDAGLVVTLSLVDAEGEIRHTWDFPYAAPWWPTERWSVGERWVGQGAARLPGSLATGDYRLVLSAPACGVLMDVPLRVTAPERRWSLPEGFSPLPDSPGLGGVTHLAGYTLASEPVRPGGSVALTLAWEALAETATSYRVFVHLIDEAGNLLAQNDGEPAMWTRPTTGWAPGEIVVDPRPLAIPATAAPGVYHIRVGLYVPGGDRLLTPAGDDAVELGSVRVGE